MTIGWAVQFATQPNLGGEVVRDAHVPDRDLFVYDAANLAAPPHVVTGVGTLLNGIAVSGSRVFVANAAARNDRDGLLALGNRMFENRLSFVDCAPSCGAVTKVDLDQNAFGAPVPVPYGVAASGDGATLVVTAASSDRPLRARRGRAAARALPHRDRDQRHARGRLAGVRARSGAGRDLPASLVHVGRHARVRARSQAHHPESDALYRRCVAFLRGSLEYEWPIPPRTGAASMLAGVLSLGLLPLLRIVRWRSRFRRAGEMEAWPWRVLRG